MFHIANPFRLRHCPSPFRPVAKSAIMRRLTCISALACCLIASCTQETVVGIPVETETKPVAKNTERKPDEPAPLPAPGGKRLMTMDPRMFTTMPDPKEMQPTAMPATANSGTNLMAPAPKPAPVPSE